MEKSLGPRAPALQTGLSSEQITPKDATLTSDPLVGAFLFPNAWKDAERFRHLVSDLRRFGINAIFTESDEYDEGAIAIAKDAGLSFYAGIACFSDHGSNFRELAGRPELWPILETGERRPQMEWYVGVTPSDRTYQRGILSKLRTIVTNYQVDAVFLDFIRWPLHWEIELRPGQPRPLDSSFDAGTLALFGQATGITLPTDLSSVAQRAEWIRKSRPQEWTDFKCQVIRDFVGEARQIIKRARPGAAIGLFYVPDVDGRTEALTGQRLSELAPLTDLVAPMLYHNILLRPPSWVGDALSRVVKVVGSGKTLPVVQADSNRDTNVPGDWGPAMSIENWQATLAAVYQHRNDLAGVLVFPGTSLVGNGRGRLLRNSLTN